MIKIENLTKKYGEKVVYDNFNLEIEKGKILVILGESGSGKTTLLSALAGLIPYQGKISGLDKPLSMVFQKNHLVENLTVYQNLELVCKDQDIIGALEEVGLSAVKDEYPKRLSAGMARRVAVARALVYPHKTLFMDEPLINLDVALKFSLIDLIKTNQKKSGATVIFVTHDIKEAVNVADRIVVLKGGSVVYDNLEITEKTENELFGLMLKLGREL